MLAGPISVPDETQVVLNPGTISRLGYIPSLDGWRAVAILAVFYCHDKPSLHPALYGLQLRFTMGVYLFFAISGFLICNRILEDEQKTGPFRLKPFYIRRFFRIQPAALTYLAVIAILLRLKVIHESWRFWLGAVFLYQNFLFTDRLSPAFLARTVLTGHFWTLAVEEHFYILLSLVLFFTLRYRVQVVASLLGLLLVAGVFVSVHFQLNGAAYQRSTWWNLPYLLLASLLALVLRNPRARQWVRGWLRPWVAFLLTFGGLILFKLVSFSPLAFLIRDRGYPIIGFSFVLWVLASTFHPQSWTSRFLSLPPLKWIGRLSYSLYLWHPLFLLPAREGVGVTWPPLVFLSHAPWRYLASFLAAYLSYRLIELPGMRLGHLLSRPRPA